MCGYHTIVAGFPWYQRDLPGILTLDNIKSLKKIKKEWLDLNKKSASDAYKFMLNKLNYKTIINASGIGDSPVKKITESNYLKEIKTLIDST